MTFHREEAVPDSSDPFTAAIVSTGEEFLRGWRNETSSSAVAAWLESRGYRILYKVCAGDNRHSLSKAIEGLSNLCGLVAVTGGLGCTKDDVSIAAAADAFGVEAHFDESIWDSIAQRLSSGPRDIHRAFATRMRDAIVLENPAGIAPGQLLVKIGTDQVPKRVLLLPGPPHETTAVLERFAEDPEAEKSLPRGPHLPGIVRLTSWGLSESVVAESLWGPGSKLLSDHGLEAKGTYTRMGGGVELALQTDGAHAIPELGRAVSVALGGATVTFDSLPRILGALARLAKSGLAVAESLTGGALGAAIVTVPGSSDYFLGGVTAYSNEMKRSLLGVPAEVLTTRGAVSEECAMAMAEGVSKLAGNFSAPNAGPNCDVAISCTGIAGPGGSTSTKPVGLVYIGVASGGEAMATRHVFHGNREAVIARTVNQCLLHGMAVFMASMPGCREKALSALATGFSEGLGFLG